MVYLFGFIKKEDNTKLLKIKMDDGKERWYKTTDEVYNYTTKSLKKNDEVTIETYKEKGQDIVKRITKGVSNAPETPQDETSQAPEASTATCIDCGAKLKDAKYKKCFKCNQKNPEQKASSTYTKSPEVQDSIKRQAIMKAACDAVATAFVGQVGDVDVLGDMIVKLYEKLLPKV